MRVLHIEGDLTTAAAVELRLKAAAIACFWAAKGEEGLELAEAFAYAAILLDLDLPDMSGFDVLAALRRKTIATPVLVLARLPDPVGDTVAALDDGADDVMGKPFHGDELVARLRAVVRRAGGHAANRIEIDRLCLDLATRTAHIDGAPLALTPTQFRLLEHLALHRGRVLSKQTLLDALYHGMDEPEEKIIDVYVSKLRRELDRHGLPADLIGTVWGQGYCIGGGRRLAPSVGRWPRDQRRSG